jgi:hypothetical protein
MTREETWPKCGHPRTDENTRRIGNGRVACRQCRKTKYDDRRKGNGKTQPKQNLGKAAGCD